MKWKHHLPSQCPPEEARREEVEVYRLVSDVPLSEEDLLPLALGPKVPHKEFSDYDNCCAHGLSTYTCLKAIKKNRKRFKKKFAGYKVVKCIIGENDGVILETYKPKHITWWVSSSSSVIAFVEVDENVAA